MAIVFQNLRLIIARNSRSGISLAPLPSGFHHPSEAMPQVPRCRMMNRLVAVSGTKHTKRHHLDTPAGMNKPLRVAEPATRDRSSDKETPKAL
jgi:hypothetical protein